MRRAAAARLGAVAVLAAAGGYAATVSLQQDFAAYYTAGAARSRGLDPYVNHAVTPGEPWDGVAVFRHSRFLYPPLVAELFRPVAALPYLAAKTLFTAGSIAALMAAVVLALPPLSPLVLAAAVWPPVLLAVERGQVDLVLLPLLALAWRAQARRPGVAGGALALAMMLKPTVLGVLPLLAAGRRWRWLLATAAGLCALGLANVAASGWALTARYALEVVPRVALYGEGGTEDMMLGEAVLDAAGGDVRGEGNARIDGREYREQIGDVLRNASIPRLLAGDGPASRWVCLIVYLALVGVLAAGARRHPEDPAWYWGGLVAAVVAAPVGWAMSLPWALPLLADGRGGTGAGVRRGLTAVWLGAGVLGLVAPVFWAAAGLGAIAFAAAATLPRRATP